MLDFVLFYICCAVSLTAVLFCLKASTNKRCLMCLLAFIISTAGLFALFNLPVLGACYFAAGMGLVLLAFLTVAENPDEVTRTTKFNETWLSALFVISVLASLLSYTVKLFPSAAVMRSLGYYADNVELFMIIMLLAVITAGAAVSFIQSEGA